MNPSTHASLVLSLLALSASASAQLSGSYTVGPSGNYSTLAAASAALSTSGVNGPVEMVLSAGGTYTESWSLSPIPGTSATNTVTFRSAVTNINTLKAKLVATAGDLLTINGGVDWLILDGLNFQTVSGASAINCLRNGTPAVAVTNLTIRNCVFGQGVVPNASYGAIRTQSINTWWLLDNEFDLNGTAVYSQGSINMEIARNVFTSNSPYCLSIWNSNKSQSRMHNNVFLGTITSACIRINLSHYGTDIFHNTFNLLIPSGSGVAVYNSSCCAVWNRYFNNIFAISGSGYAINHLNQKDIELNNNLYWTASKVIGSYNNTTYNTLAAWGAALGTYAQNGNNDNNSIVADPLFKPATSFELLPASPAVGKALPQPASWTAGHEVLDDLRGYMRGNKKDIGAWEVSGCRAFASGCSGTSGKVPALTCSGNVGPGDTVNLDLTNGLASATVYTAIGATNSPIPLGGNCSLLTNPIFLFMATTDGSGNYTLSAQIPVSLPVVGLSAYAQMGVVDPAAAGIGAAMSNGLELRL